MSQNILHGWTPAIQWDYLFYTKFLMLGWCFFILQKIKRPWMRMYHFFLKNILRPLMKCVMVSSIIFRVSFSACVVFNNLGTKTPFFRATWMLFNLVSFIHECFRKYCKYISFILGFVVVVRISKYSLFTCAIYSETVL